MFTPDPLAIGFPTAGDPVLIDTSASLTTNGMSNRMRAQGRQYEHAFFIDAQGRETRDPAVLFADPPGTILPVGGTAAGHKGYGLALLVETLTGGSDADKITITTLLSKGLINLGVGADELALGDFANSATISDVETLVGGSSNDTITLGSAMLSGNSLDLGAGSSEFGPSSGMAPGMAR